MPVRLRGRKRNAQKGKSSEAPEALAQIAPHEDPSESVSVIPQDSAEKPDVPEEADTHEGSGDLATAEEADGGAATSTSSRVSTVAPNKTSPGSRENVSAETSGPATRGDAEGVREDGVQEDGVEEGIVAIRPATRAQAAETAEAAQPSVRETVGSPEEVDGPKKAASPTKDRLETRLDATVGVLGSFEADGGDYVARPIPRVIAVANQKGGVGKTTTAVNLGAGLAELGYRVLVVDLDPQANATTGLGIDGRSFELSMYDVLMRDAKMEDAIEPTSLRNLFVAPATIDLAGAEIELVPTFSRELKLRRALDSISGDFDFTLIDCPPSLGLITVNGLAAAHEILVPIQCEYYALEGLGQLLRNVGLVQGNLNEHLDLSTIVLTMYDGRTKLAEQVVEEVRSHFGRKVCRNVIPRTVRISEAPSFGQPITSFDSSSRGAIAYRELAREVSGGAA
jgi:chromosome partitioning protein